MRRPYAKVIFMLMFGFAVFVSIIHDVTVYDEIATINYDGLVETESVPAPQQQTIGMSPFLSDQCLNSEELIEEIISRASKHASVIAMPAKAAGTSMKDYVRACMKQDMPDNFLNDEGDTKTFLMKGQLHPPKVIASHMYNGAILSKIIANLPSEALLIYIHRHERDRLLSAIKTVIQHRGHEFCNIRYNETTNTCVLDEDKLFEPIVKKYHEIGFGDANTLTCEVYDSIERNSPNMLFMDYKEAVRLQKLLSKYHCPEMGGVHTNNDSIKAMRPKVQMQEKPEEILIDLGEWLNAKADYISLAFKLQDENGCQGKTREMERKLQSCPTMFLKV